MAKRLFTLLLAVVGLTLSAFANSTVDFEDDLSSFSDWAFTNITKSNTVTAHGGSYYGSTSSSTTASIQTKSKVASPQTLTCYVSKESTNSKTATWTIQVSSDGSTWTSVGNSYDYSTSGSSKGQWDKLTADLSTYSNVYVRVYYNGNTAIRAIDDIELTDGSSSSSVARPTYEATNIVGVNMFYPSTTLTLSCSTAGATIYYAVGSSSSSMGTFQVYSDSVRITNTSCVQAYAKKDGVQSQTLTIDLTKATPYTSIPQLFTAATTSEQSVVVDIPGWIVTGVNNSNAYLQDADKNVAVIYQSGHGFQVGDYITGTVGTTLVLYNGIAELKGLTANTSGLKKGAGIPRSTDVQIANISESDFGKLYKITNVYFKANTFVSGSFYAYTSNNDSILLHNSFYTNITNFTFDTTKTYNLTGIIQVYKGTLEICPRTPDDIAEVTGNITVDVPIYNATNVLGNGVFYPSTEITFLCATDGASIYYSIDTQGNGPSFQLYSSPVALSTDATIMAYAMSSGVMSDTLSFTLRKAHTYNSIPEVFNAATSEQTPALLNIPGWTVTGVISKNAYLQDADGNVAVIYQSSHGFQVGDYLTGSVTASIMRYSGIAEIVGLSSSTSGLTKTTATPVATEMAIGDITAADYGRLITVKGVYFKSTTYEYEGINVYDESYTDSILLYNSFYSAVSTTQFENIFPYDFTGIVQSYNGALEICPRSASDMVKISNQVVPTCAWANTEVTVNRGETVNNPFVTNSDARVTYESSNELVAKIDSMGNIIVGAAGKARIWAKMPATLNFYPAERSFTLTVTETDDVEEIVWTPNFDGYDVGETKSNYNIGNGFTLTSEFYAAATQIRYYIGKSIGLQAPEGYLIHDVTMLCSSNTYIDIATVENESAIDTAFTLIQWAGQPCRNINMTVSGKQVRPTEITIHYIEDRRQDATLSIYAASETILLGQSMPFTVETNTGRTPLFTIDNPNIAIIDSDGTIKPLRRGYFTLKAELPTTLEWNAATATCAFLVKGEDDLVLEPLGSSYIGEDVYLNTTAPGDYFISTVQVDFYKKNSNTGHTFLTSSTITSGGEFTVNECYDGFSVRSETYTGRTLVQYESEDFPIHRALVFCTPIPIGDANGDFIVNIDDISTLARYISEEIYAISLKADMNGDGEISIQDLTELIELLKAK